MLAEKSRKKKCNIFRLITSILRIAYIPTLWYQNISHICSLVGMRVDQGGCERRIEVCGKIHKKKIRGVKRGGGVSYFSRIGFEGWIWVLIASVPDLCILFTCLFKFCTKFRFEMKLVLNNKERKTSVSSEVYCYILCLLSQ